MKANQVRLWLSSMAYVVMNEVRRVGLEGTALEQATCGTMRLKLLKIGARVVVSVRRVVVSMASSSLQPVYSTTPAKACTLPTRPA